MVKGLSASRTGERRWDWYGVILEYTGGAMNTEGLGGGMKRGSGRGRRLDFFRSSSLSPSPFCSVFSDREFLSDRRRVTITEGLWSVLVWSLWIQAETRPGSSLDGEASSLRTGTETGITRGTRVSSRERFTCSPSSLGLQGL